MNLKTFFNKAIFKSDMKRLWPFGILYSGCMFFSTFFIFTDKNRSPEIGALDYVSSQLCSSSYTSIFFGIVFAALLAIFLFSYVNSVKTVSFYHSIPVKRSAVYFTRLLSGLIMLTVPVFITVMLAAFLKIGGVKIPGPYSYLMIFAGIQILYTTVAFTGVMFVAYFTGNVISLIGTCGIIAALPGIVYVFLSTVFNDNIYGFTSLNIDFIKYVYLLPANLVTWRWTIYLAFIIIFIILGLVFYSLRNLERCGEAYVFKPIKTAFVYIAAFIGGVLGYFYFQAWFTTNILYFLPFGLIALIIANMVNKRSFSFKGSLKPGLIFTAAVFCVFLCFKYDITGFEKRVPEQDTIKSVNIYLISADNEVYWGENGKQLSPEFKVDYNLYSNEDIYNAIKYHEHKIADKDKNNGTSIYITYTLKSGKKLQRQYLFDKDEDKAFADLFMSDPMKAQRYDFYMRKNLDFTSVSITNNFNPYENSTLYKGNDMFEPVLNAVMEDIKNLDYSNDASLNYGYSESVTKPMITLEYNVPVVDEAGNKSTVKSSSSIVIGKGCPRTRAALEELGLLRKEIDTSLISKIGFSYSYSDIPFKEDFGSDTAQMAIDNPNEIKNFIQNLAKAEDNAPKTESGDVETYDPRSLTIIVMFKDNQTANYWTFPYKGLCKECDTLINSANGSIVP